MPTKRFAYVVRDCAQRFARVRFAFLTWETESVVHPRACPVLLSLFSRGKIQSSERRIDTKDGKQLLDMIPSNFPHQARDFCAVLRQCGGHEFHEVGEWEELFLNNWIQRVYGRNWKAKDTGF
jgi:hypothetical protein